MPTAPTPTADPAVAGSAAPVTPPAQPSQADVDRSNDFAGRVFTTAASAKPGNVFISPTSLRLALGVVSAGAEGETLAELAKGLSLDPDPAAAGRAAKTELADWRSKKGVVLTIASRLFADGGTPLAAPFADAARDSWGAPVEPVDFKTQPEKARGIVNAWVKKETQEKIPVLLPEGSVSANTQLVVANAIYFLGTWAIPFDTNETRPVDFTLQGGKKKKVPTMHKTASYRYVEDAGTRLVELPYGTPNKSAETMAMVIALPKSTEDLGALEKRLSSSTFTAWRTALAASSHRLALSMPKVEVRWGGSVRGTLQALGVARLFTTAAELGKIGAKLAVSDVFHMTYVKIDEKGTEAAAATGVVIGVTSLPPPPKPFAIDRPFLFYIHDTTTGRVLFIGRVADPAGG